MSKPLLLLTLVLFLGCQKKDGFSPSFKVPPQFQPIVDSFLTAASARGRQMTIDNLIIQYDSTLPNGICAQSNVISSENNIQKIIYVNALLHCAQNDQMMETLIFHEMGHCLLGRRHDGSLLPNGDPKSIMIANDITIYSPCLYNLGNPNCDKRSRRSYYIDELFNPSTPVPDWGK